MVNPPAATAVVIHAPSHAVKPLAEPKQDAIVAVKETGGVIAAVAVEGAEDVVVAEEG